MVRGTGRRVSAEPCPPRRGAAGAAGARARRESPSRPEAGCRLDYQKRPQIAPRQRYSGRVELSRLLDELTRAAAKVGVAVRTEAFDPHLSDARRPRGGLCTVLGRRLILVDVNASLPDRIATVATALGQVDLEAIYLPPIVRATIGAYSPAGALARAPRLAPAAPPPRLRRAPTTDGAAAPPLPLARARWRDRSGER